MFGRGSSPAVDKACTPMDAQDGPFLRSTSHATPTGPAAAAVSGYLPGSALAKGLLAELQGALAREEATNQVRPCTARVMWPVTCVRCEGSR
jgi:hypothetical protein